MSRRHKTHIPGLAFDLEEYAYTRNLDFYRYSEYHLRIMDQGITVFDAWTTGRYYVLDTNYHKLTDKTIVERAGEKGHLPFGKEKIFKFLDKLFFAADMEE